MLHSKDPSPSCAPGLASRLGLEEEVSSEDPAVGGADGAADAVAITTFQDWRNPAGDEPPDESSSCTATRVVVGVGVDEDDG